MDKIHIARGSQQLGQFSPDEVFAGLQSGKFFPTDLGWQEGMQEWQPLSTFQNLGSAADAGSSSDTLEEAMVMPIIEEGPGEVQPAWERRGASGFLAPAFETIKQVLTDPGGTFSAMPRQGGFGNPLAYCVILSWIGMVASFLYQIIYVIANPAALEQSMEGVSTTIMVSVLAAFIVFAPLLLIAVAFVNAAFMHFFLWLLGGASRPYEATFRVLCYAQGSTAVLQLIPICGGIISSVWYFYCAVVGLAKTHETEIWRVIVAVFLPLILFCGLLIVLVSVLGGAAIMQPPSN